MVYTHPATGTVEDLAYTYDENSNRTSETSVEGLSSYVFDLRNQLIQATYPAAPGGNPAIEDFRYDLAGNRLERRHTRDEAAGSVESTTTYTYTVGDRLETEVRADSVGGLPAPVMSSKQYEFDGNCNQTRIHETRPGEPVETTTYTWNARNQLTQVTYPDAGFSLNAYYPDSPLRRLHVRKDGEATAFLWDPLTQNNLEDIEVGSGATRATHQHGTGMD